MDDVTEIHFQLTDADLEDQFCSCRLNPAYFSHEAHLRLAWIHLKKYGLEKAIENLSRQIKAYAEYLGAKDKFHATLTVAAIKTVRHFMDRSSASNFTNFIAENPRLKTRFKELIGSHYEMDIFNSEIARQEYIAPDKLPYD